MLSSAFNFIGSIFHKQRDAVEERALQNEKKWKKLVMSDFDHELLHDFASSVLAQEIPDEAFSVLISAGKKDIVSYFFEVEQKRGDALSAAKISSILNLYGLNFIDNGHAGVTDEMEIRALRLLTGYAAIEASGLLQLIVSHRCALVAISLWRTSLLRDVILMQSVATVGGFKSQDLKRYCQSPATYKIDEHSSLSISDLLLIDTIRKNPTRVFDILFLQEVA